MRIIRNIVHLAIVLALLATGFPMLKGDVNRDERVDLADAVLSVQGVARSVDNPASFEKNVENAIISLAAAAGVQKALKANNDRVEVKTFHESPPAVLLAGFTSGAVPSSGMSPVDSPFLYQSIVLTPLVPPPHAA